jgi:hypothetical protein
MSGMLLTALQFYTRTRTQRWLFAGALALWTAQLVVARAACPCPSSFTVWPFILGGLCAGAAAALLISSAWDFRRISALRTVYLIPYSRLKLVGGMLLAQCFAALIVAGLVMLVGEAHALPPLGWGSARGTFEMLFGCALCCVVMVQVITGPSRVVSVASLALVTPLGLRPDLFMQPDLIGLPKAHVLASAGILVWLVFAAWFVGAWRPAVPLSV